MKIYRGNRTSPCDVVVTVDGKPLKHIVYHSPTGFNWGYGGSGPADLALSILADCFSSPRPTLNVVTKKWYQIFKREIVASWEGEWWMITEDEIREWLVNKLKIQRREKP